MDGRIIFFKTQQQKKWANNDLQNVWSVNGEVKYLTDVNYADVLYRLQLDQHQKNVLRTNGN